MSDKDDIFSSHSNKNDQVGEFKRLMQTKGKLFLVFRSELTEDFVERVEKIKVNYLKDTQEKMEQLRVSIDQKQVVIKQSLESLFHISFEPERGLVLDQLSSRDLSRFDEAAS